MREYVESKPDKQYHTVGEDGILLSGGLRQRIALARAFYRQSKFIFLDEATSALDTKTERSLLQTLADCNSEVGIISISHRNACLQFCTASYRLEDGKLSTIKTGH